MRRQDLRRIFGIFHDQAFGQFELQRAGRDLERASTALTSWQRDRDAAIAATRR